MRFLFLNQYAPPDPAPTARLLGMLAEALEKKGHEVRFVSSTHQYRARREPPAGRLRRELRGLREIFLGGLRMPRPDWVLALSSPPCLLILAALIALRHRARLAHWAMDLYPDLAIALGEIPPGPVAGFFSSLMQWAYRRCDLLIALDRDMQSHFQKKYGVASKALPPWPVLDPPQPGSAPPQDRSFTWLYSGNLGRAHEWETLLEAQAELDRRQCNAQLVFQGGGAALAAANARARRLGLKNCRFRDYAPHDKVAESLLEAGALVATQRPETLGMLWPSKLTLATRLRRPLLWIGPPEGEIYKSQPLSFAPGDWRAIADAIKKMAARDEEPPLPEPVGSEKEEGIAQLVAWLETGAVASRHRE